MAAGIALIVLGLLTLWFGRTYWRKPLRVHERLETMVPGTWGTSPRAVRIRGLILIVVGVLCVLLGIGVVIGSTTS